VSVVERLIDLNFVVDSSSSIELKGEGNWNISLQFIEDVIRQFTVGPNNVQVALVRFSKDATVEWDLTQYQDSAGLIDAVQNVPYTGVGTNLNDALHLTWSEVFAPGRGSRPNAEKVAIILTDGEDNKPERGSAETIENAVRCKEDGIRLIAIGVTDRVNRDQLIEIASSASDYIPVDDFNALETIIDQLTEQIYLTTNITTTTVTTTIETATSTTSAHALSIRLHSVCCIHI